MAREMSVIDFGAVMALCVAGLMFLHFGDFIGGFMVLGTAVAATVVLVAWT